MPLTLEDIGGLPHGDKLKGFFSQAMDDSGMLLPLSVPAKGGTIFGSIDPRTANVAVSAGVTNNCFGTRVIVPRTGRITDLAYFVGTGSGNYDLGIYSVSGTNRTLLQSSGSQAQPGATNDWFVKSGYSVVVTGGDILDLCLAMDNNVGTFGRVNLAAGMLGALPSGWDPDVAGSEVLNWVKGSAFPLPASHSSVVRAANTTFVPVILARMTAF